MPDTMDEAADQQIREGADGDGRPPTVSFAVPEEKGYRILCLTAPIAHD
jgi:hypothetical protein